MQWLTCTPLVGCMVIKPPIACAEQHISSQCFACVHQQRVSVQGVCATACAAAEARANAFVVRTPRQVLP
jgi:hypothetical protein